MVIKTKGQKKEERKQMSQAIRAEMKASGTFAKQAVKKVLAKKKR